MMPRHVSRRRLDAQGGTVYDEVGNRRGDTAALSGQIPAEVMAIPRFSG